MCLYVANVQFSKFSKVNKQKSEIKRETERKWNQAIKYNLQMLKKLKYVKSTVLDYVSAEKRHRK